MDPCGTWLVNDFIKFYYLFFYCKYTAKNTTDMLQVVNFTGLLQLSTSCNKLVNFVKLQQVC